MQKADDIPICPAAEARYRTLLEINNAIITCLSRDTLLRSVTQILRGIVPFDGAIITIYEPATESFLVFALESKLTSERHHVGLSFRRNETIAAHVLAEGRASVRRDIRMERKYPNDSRLLAAGVLSDCIVPLMVGGKAIGTLGVGSTRTNQYSEADAEILQDVANQIALAVSNMRAYEEIADLKGRLEKEIHYLQEEIRNDHNFEEIAGNSPALLAVLRQVQQVAPTDSTVLITGETGTGKELIARAVHDRSNRKNRPLVKINCSAISAGLVESELFGHVKGAFTGALDNHTGRFELADRGTIFLDEIGDLPAATQVKLLRVLQEREFEPVGSNRTVKVDVRVIAATNRNLPESIKVGEFRSDLFYRLNVFPIEVPPLRERRSDIPQLAMLFLSRIAKQLGKAAQGICPETLALLTGYAWPGNIRELQNMMERAAILSPGKAFALSPQLITSMMQAGSGAGPEVSPKALSHTSEPSTLQEVDRAHIAAVLKQTGGVVEGPRGAARVLGLHPNTLRHRLRKLGLRRTSPQEL